MKVVTTYPGARYPDFLVTCDSRDLEDRLVKRHPKLIIEILAQGTASVDTGDTLDEYQTIPELEEYVLIDSRKSSVRVYRREGATLVTEPVTPTGAVELRSPGLTLSLADIYVDIDFERARSDRTQTLAE